MSDLLVVSVGSFACGCVLESVRKERAAHWQRDSRSSVNDEYHFETLALDVDGTAAHRLNAPPAGTDTGWPLGMFRVCPLPGNDLVERIAAGHYPGRFEQFNPGAVSALQGHADASGAVRSAGWLAVRRNRKMIAQEIRRRFTTIIGRRRIMSQAVGERVRVLLVAGLFGGFGSGAQDELLKLVCDIAGDLNLDVGVSRILLVPGTNLSKDQDTSCALAYGTLTEIAAQATRSHWQRALPLRGDHACTDRSRFVPTLLLSDTNSAHSAEPRVLSPENFAGMVAELLSVYRSPLGARLDALVADFEAAAIQVTAAGEPKCASSVGLSQIVLDLPALEAFAIATLSDALLAQSAAPVEREIIRRDVRSFFEARRLVEGLRAHQLSDRLLESDIDRFRQLSERNLMDLRGMRLFAEATRRLEGTERQLRHLNGSMETRAERFEQSIVRDMHARTTELGRAADAGCGAVRQWITEAMSVCENMIAESARDTPVFEQRIAQHQRRLDYYTTHYLPMVQRRSSAFRLMNRRGIGSAAIDYRRDLEERLAARMQLAAHLRAVEVLKKLRGACEARLTEVQRALDSIAGIRDAVHADATRIAAHKPDYRCPIGLALINGPVDFQQYYQRILPDGGQDEALLVVHAQLAVREIDVLQLAAEPERLRKELGLAVAHVFTEKLQKLQVAEEFKRRFANGQCGAVLHERILEAYERFPLRDSCDEEHGVSTVRLLGIDVEHAGGLPDLIAQFDDRGTPFEVVSVPDRQRITFLQFRAVFPISGWAGFDRARAAYCQLSEPLAFERFHVSVGDRFLPVPGEKLTAHSVKLFALKAWLGGRLGYDSARCQWQLRVEGERPYLLGSNFEALRTADGYRLAVDVSSWLNCLYSKLGPEHLRDRISQLQSARAGAAKCDSLPARLAAVVDDDCLRVVGAELDLWRTNTVAGAFAASAQHGHNGDHADRRND